MDPKQKYFIACTIVLCLIAIGLSVTAMATDAWVTADIRKYRNTSENVNASSPSGATTKDDGIEKFTGVMKFGLFRGYRKVNFGFGVREASISVVCDVGSNYCIFFNTSTTTSSGSSIISSNSISGKEVLQNLINSRKNSTVSKEDNDLGLFNCGLWVSTIFFCLLGMVWGLLSIGFSFFNVLGKPIETITGPLGLYLWNFGAVLSSMVAVITYIELFLKYYRINIILEGDSTLSSYTHKDSTYLDYSFYLMTGSLVAYILNIVLLILSGQKLKCGYTKAADKVMDNGIILY